LPRGKLGVENFCLPRGKPRVESFCEYICHMGEKEEKKGIGIGTWRMRNNGIEIGTWRSNNRFGIGTWREETEWVLTCEKEREKKEREKREKKREGRDRKRVSGKEEGSSLGEENTLLASTGTHLDPFMLVYTSPYYPSPLTLLHITLHVILQYHLYPPPS